MAKRENSRKQNRDSKPKKKQEALKKLSKKKEKAGHRRSNNKDSEQIGDRNSNRNQKNSGYEENTKNNKNRINFNNIKGKYQTNNFGNKNNNGNNNRRKFDNKKDKTEKSFYNEELEIANDNQDNDFFDFNSNSNIFTKLKNSEPNKIVAENNIIKNKENKGNFLIFSLYKFYFWKILFYVLYNNFDFYFLQKYFTANICLKILNKTKIK